MSTQIKVGHMLILYGIILFLLGLITGFIIPTMQNPRMGLSSHLEATMNGMFLILMGLVWPKLQLSDRLHKWAYGLLLFGTYVNWGTTLFAAVIGAGSELMPLAGNNLTGTMWQEFVIKFGLITLSLSMIAVCIIVIVGLKKTLSNTERF